MKNLKFYGIVMMLVMGMSFASCSSDDDGPSSGSIEESIEGEWFLVSEKYEGTNDGTITTTWDYEDQTADGYSSDGYSEYPQKLYIERVSENRYEAVNYYYNGQWRIDTSEIYEIDGNVIFEETEEEYGSVYYTKIYIKSISEDKLVIVGEEKLVDEDGTDKTVSTYTYRRNK